MQLIKHGLRNNSSRFPSIYVIIPHLPFDEISKHLRLENSMHSTYCQQYIIKVDIHKQIYIFKNVIKKIRTRYKIVLLSISLL